jgi:hypothetical protein
VNIHPFTFIYIYIRFNRYTYLRILSFVLVYRYILHERKLNQKLLKWQREFSPNWFRRNPIIHSFWFIWSMVYWRNIRNSNFEIILLTMCVCHLYQQRCLCFVIIEETLFQRAIRFIFVFFCVWKYARRACLNSPFFSLPARWDFFLTTNRTHRKKQKWIGSLFERASLQL